MPGLFLRELMQIPESSAKQGILNFLNPYKDLIFAFSAKLSPLSFGSLVIGKSFKLIILTLLLKNTKRLIRSLWRWMK